MLMGHEVIINRLMGIDVQLIDTHWSPRIDTPQVHTDKHAKSVEIIAQAHFWAQMIELNSIDSMQLNRSIPASVPPALLSLV